jgi:hypothetical protein
VDALQLKGARHGREYRPKETRPEMVLVPRIPTKEMLDAGWADAHVRLDEYSQDSYVIFPNRAVALLSRGRVTFVPLGARISSIQVLPEELSSQER